MKIKHAKITLILAGLCLMALGCNTAKVTRQKSITAAPTAKPLIVYVADFDLDAGDIQAGNRLLSSGPKLPGPFANILPPLPGSPKNPQELSRKLVKEMSNALVHDLNKAGFTARRAANTNSLSNSGWLVRGVFTEVNQGSQMLRAIIGFGAGQTELQVLVDIADLSRGAPQPFYQLATAADSGKAPGAGPMIVVCPAGAVARLIIAGKDLDRNVTHTAAKVAQAIVERTRSTEIAASLK